MANGETNKGRHITSLPFPQLSEETTEIDTFDELKTLLVSVGKITDDGSVSIFTTEEVKISI